MELTRSRLYQSFPGVSDGKESACNSGDLGSIPGSGRSPGEGNGYPLQYSCLENSMDIGAWQVIVHEVAKSQIILSDQHTQSSQAVDLFNLQVLKIQFFEFS